MGRKAEIFGDKSRAINLDYLLYRARNNIRSPSPDLAIKRTRNIFHDVCQPRVIDD